MEIPSPPNVKGESYEDSISHFFEKYLGSIYDFHTRVSIIDFLGLCFEEFKPIENEFDIVATYKTAVPKIILEHKRQKFIPHDSVAFIIQVKQDLDKGKLKSDLEKLKKIRSLDTWEKAIERELEKVVEESFMVLGKDEHPLISLICLIPVMVPYPIVCNSTAFFLVNVFPESLIFSLGPKFTEILLEEILKRNKK